MDITAASARTDSSVGRHRLPMAMNLAGALVLVSSWWNSANTVRLSTQVAWVVVGLIGVIVSGLANLIELRGWRVAIVNRLARLAPRVALAQGQLGLEPLLGGPSVLRFSPADAVAVDTGTFYHRPSCALVTGKPAVGASIPAHEAAGRRPCGVCEP